MTLHEILLASYVIPTAFEVRILKAVLAIVQEDCGKSCDKFRV
jgi:hypothetical protein